MATTEDWATMETFADDPIATGTRCILDLRRRVEALEQRAAPGSEVISAHGCADVVLPAPAADRPLWREVRGAMQAVPGEFDWVAAQLAVADWLAAREHCGAASALRSEARRAREGA